MADYPLEAGGRRGADGGRRQGEHQQCTASDWSDGVGGARQGGPGTPRVVAGEVYR